MTDIESLLGRGVDKIYPSREALEAKLNEGQKLKVYLGVDPSGGDLHVGHTVPLRKLRHFQDLGHHIILLIGSFTGMIGDPTGKSQTRKPLTKEQVVENAKDYAQQAAKILDFTTNPPEIVYNGDWLEKLSFKDVVELASHFTVQQMLERDMFENRIKNKLPVHLHEFLYPLMQGYDSVHMQVDVEIGGSDQTFNMLAGRKLEEEYIGKEKFVLVTPLITDKEGRKMGKSEGNAIPIRSTPQDMYGVVMSLPDDFIQSLFIQCTDVPMDEILSMLQHIERGANPMDYKKKLAYELVRIFHSEEEAQGAQKFFESTVQNDQLPEDIPEWSIDAGLYELVELLSQIGIIDSKSEAKRLSTQGWVVVIENGEEKKITDPRTYIQVKDNMVIRAGKRRYIRLRVVDK
jgi:tyrosyl-tRNA synthetase